MRNDFTMFKRTVPSGKKVVYYYAYDANGVRKGPWTTNCHSITEARNFINTLIRTGVLIPDRKKPVPFGEYAKGFWEPDSAYIRHQKSRGDVTEKYMDLSRGLVNCQILPFFSAVPLDKITSEGIDKWLLGFKDRGIKDEKTGGIKGHYKNSYANAAYRTFNIMLAEAVRQGLIKSNPCSSVKRLKNNRKEIEILTVEEVRKLFPKDYRSVWGDKEIAYAANLLASITGMRIGEILGLRGEYVFDSYVLVCGQYGPYGYQNYTKTKENRSIPVMPEMIALLQNLMKKNGKGYVFSLTGGAAPVSRNYIAKEFGLALEKTGISGEEMKKRGLTLHGWRHFLNTELQRQGFTVKQVQSVTGHKSERMTDWYNHLNARDIPEVTNAQAVILEGEKKNPAPGGAGAMPALALVKRPEHEKTPERKHA